MTIVMEEDAFSSSLSSLSTLSPQTNYQALLGRDSLNSSYLSNTSISSPSVSSNQQSPNGNTTNPENCPYAVFIFRSNGNNTSELFEERRIMLDKSCKIGRSVAKIRPEPNNAIFDCKVLSRNHALLWEEKGKFYIQDTKSSNGTFLNGNRLGKSNEDSPPYELTSGDIIQFGVDVTENTKKVTHGCITVEVRLFHKPGVEAINKPATQQNNKVDVQTQELYQLALFLQEAMMREEILNRKLISLQTFIDQAKQTSENGWLTLIQEDRLLSRIDCLEKQTNLNNKSITEDQFKKTINALREEKLKIEDSAKETIQKIIEEKLESNQRLDELKAMYDIQTEECTQFKNLNEELRDKIIDLAAKNQELLLQIESIQSELEEQKTKCNEISASAESEKETYENKIKEFLENEKILTAQIELLSAEKDIQSKQLEGLLTKFEQIKQMNEFYVKKLENYEQEFERNQRENIKSETIVDQTKSENLSEPENEDTDKKTTIKNEVLNDVSNNIALNEENGITVKEIPIVTNCVKNLDDEKENIVITGENLNSVSESGIIMDYSSINSKLKIEIEELKSKLEHEINSNLKLKSKNEQNQAKDKLTDSFHEETSFDSILKEKAVKLDELEKELEEKNCLIGKLLKSKNELLNINLTNVLNISKANDSFDLKDTHVNTSTNLEYEKEIENKSCFFPNDSVNELDQFKAQIQVVQMVVRQFLDDSPVLVTKPADEGDYYFQLEDSYKKLEELKTILNAKKSKAEINGSKNGEESKRVFILESKIKELEQKCEEYKSKLDTTDSVLEDLNEGYDNLSLRAKINFKVSYFSMVPISFLIFAVLIAFYPILAKITATDL